MVLWKFIRENIPKRQEIVDNSGCVRKIREIEHKRYSNHLQVIRQVLHKNIVAVAPFYSNFFPVNPDQSK